MDLAISDRLDILDVITRADNAASRRDPDAYVEFFTDDVVLDGDQGIYVGKKALHQAVGPIWAREGDTTLHLTLNSTLEAVGSNTDEVIANSVLLLVQPGGTAKVLTAALITQRLKRIGAFWRIGHRTVTALI